MFLFLFTSFVVVLFCPVLPHKYLTLRHGTLATKCLLALLLYSEIAPVVITRTVLLNFWNWPLWIGLVVTTATISKVGQYSMGSPSRLTRPV